MAGTRIGMNGYVQFLTPSDLIIYSGTGKSFSEVLILALTNPQYDKKIVHWIYQFSTWKFQAQNMGRTCCVQKLFLTFRTISVHYMFSTCSAQRRASDKDLPVWRKKQMKLTFASNQTIFQQKSAQVLLKCEKILNYLTLLYAVTMVMTPYLLINWFWQLAAHFFAEFCHLSKINSILFSI